MKFAELKRDMSHTAKFSWIPVFGKNGHLRTFKCMSLKVAAKLPFVTRQELETMDEKGEPKLNYDDYGRKFITKEALLDFMIDDLRMAYPEMPKNILKEARRSTVRAFKSITGVMERREKESRISCKAGPFCKQRRRIGPRWKGGLFYPSEVPTSPYCSRECLKVQQKKGWYLVRRPSGAFMKLFDRVCTSCEKKFWGTSRQKRCDKCIEKAKKPKRRKRESPKRKKRHYITCAKCGKQFSRIAKRGRKPKFCPKCR